MILGLRFARFSDACAVGRRVTDQNEAIRFTKHLRQRVIS